MITFWRQPGNKTMKVAMAGKPQRHVSTHHCNIAIAIAQKLGHTVTDHGHKVTIEQKA